MQAGARPGAFVGNTEVFTTEDTESTEKDRESANNRINGHRRATTDRVSRAAGGMTPVGVGIAGTLAPLSLSGFLSLVCFPFLYINICRSLCSLCPLR